MNNQINIEEKRTIYDVKYTYHSDMKCQNYDAKIIGIEEANGRVTLEPRLEVSYETGLTESSFLFNHSDPDRVIAIAQMMMAFAQMVKNKSKNTIDTDDNE